VSAYQKYCFKTGKQRLTESIAKMTYSMTPVKGDRRAEVVFTEAYECRFCKAWHLTTSK
jgi:hypothetical protein